MVRITIGIFLVVFAAGLDSAQAQRVSCTYETCMNACTTRGGGNRSGGCSTWCEKTLKERKMTGVCK